MESFNFNKLRDFIPKDLPQVPLPRWPSNMTRRSMNPDEDSEGPTADSHPLEEGDDIVPPAGEASMVLAEPKPIDSGPKSYLDLVNECDNFPYYQNNPRLFFAYINTYYGLYVKDFPDAELGYVLPSVAEVFRNLPDWKIDDSERSLTLIAGANEEERTKAVAFVTQAMRATDHFQVLKGWRNEMYPVYGPDGKVLFSIERSASPLFGIVTYGCHMTVFTINKKDDEQVMKIWVPKRAKSKQTYGGMLDNTVAGGISTGETPLESMVRESEEEASLSEELVRKHAKAAGTVTYFHIRDERAGGETRLLQPECQYVYDLEVTEDFVPKPNDNEVESFELMTVEQVKEALRDGQFKPNCALVLIDFFVRRGFITAEDKGYIDIVARLHRKFEFPTV